MDTTTFLVTFDIAMAIFFLLFGFWVYKSGGKAMNYLSGYNTKTEDERKKYDEKQMSVDYGKRIMFWAVPFLIGAIIDIKYTGKGILIAWGIWGVLVVLFLAKRFKLER